MTGRCTERPWMRDPLLAEVIAEAASRNNKQIREDEQQHGEAAVALRFLVQALSFDTMTQRWSFHDGALKLAPELRILREMLKGVRS